MTTRCPSYKNTKKETKFQDIHSKRKVEVAGQTKLSLTMPEIGKMRESFKFKIKKILTVTYIWVVVL